MNATRETLSSITAVALRSFAIMADGDLLDFEEVIHPLAQNRESGPETEAARGRGPAAFLASALWLRSAYSDLEWTVHDVVADRNTVVTHMTMSGRHTGPFVLHDETGAVDHVFAPTGKSFSVSQTHWERFDSGKVIEHWANRDDMGQSLQLGWVPPTPVYLMRCALAKRRAKRDASS